MIYIANNEEQCEVSPSTTFDYANIVSGKHTIFCTEIVHGVALGSDG